MSRRKGQPAHGPAWAIGLALILAALAGPAAGGRADEPAEPPANRLARETSPYLLEHAHNPVDWYPWGPEAFARARAEDKPIFLSVGYSSCYWCHVMERECFLDEGIAKALNDHFVCIKVDREERPDVDQVYMAALQEFGSGGWPMSLFLTPEGKPFFGGTYFPPKEREGAAGFPTVLNTILDAWRDKRAVLEKDAEQVTERVRRKTADADAPRHLPLSRAMAAEGRAGLAEQFDAEYGGFGFDPERPDRPKFPEPPNLLFLLDQHRRDATRKAAGSASNQPGREPLAMVLKTMDRMARGGIRDHLAGGYHRYSVDRTWTVPHFEKMLYDNAQLASAHVLAFEITGDARWRREAEDTFAFVSKVLTSPEGGFFSALDAEAEGQEGEPYVWSKDEVRRLVGDDDYEFFARLHGLDGEPNFTRGRYVLLLPRPIAEQAEALRIKPEELEARLRPIRIRLLDARDKRPAPLRDDKVLTAWNGLMIAAYADGFRVLKDESYRRAAETAADFLMARLRAPEGRLLRTYRVGQAKLPAYLEDYAFLAHGLLRLHAATGNRARLDQARALIDRMIDDFADGERGGFFYTADDHESLLARTKDPYDNALPSGNGVAVRDLVALTAATGDARYLDEAGLALDAFAPAMSRNPAGLPTMLVALEEFLDARPDGPKPPQSSGEPGRRPGLKKPAVTAEAALDGRSTVRPGQEFDVTLTLNVKDGWHIYANPPGSEIPKPTTVSLAGGSPFSLVWVDYPPGETKTLIAGQADEVNIFQGKIALTARVRASRAAKVGPAELAFQVRYQACNDRACLAPTRLAVPLQVTVASR